MNIRIVAAGLLALASSLCATSALAQTPAAPAPAASANTGTKVERQKPFDVSLVMINGASTSGATAGLKYQYQKVHVLKASKDYDSVGSDRASAEEFGKASHAAILDLNSAGVLAANKDLNPHKLIDFAGAFSWERLAGDGTYYTRLGSTLLYETDQAFKNRQKMFGVTAQITSSIRLLSGNDTLTAIVNYGDVKPDKDETRKKIEGNLDSFKRWSGEVTFSANISKYAPSESVQLLQWRQLHIGYRHYQEVSPSAAIKAAGLDRNRLGYVRLVIAGNFYAQYAKGSLPFDHKSDRVVQLGYSTTIP